MQNEKRKWLIRCEVMMYLRGQAGLFDETLLVTARFDLGVRTLLMATPKRPEGSGDY